MSRTDTIDLSELRAFAAPVIERGGPKLATATLGCGLTLVLHPWVQVPIMLVPLALGIAAEWTLARYVLRKDLAGPALRRAARATRIAAGFFALTLIWAAFVVIQNDPMQFELRVVSYFIVLAGIFDAGLLLGANRRASEVRLGIYIVGGLLLLAFPIALDPGPHVAMDITIVLMMAYVSYVFLSDVRRSRDLQASANRSLAAQGAENRKLATMVENATDGILMVRRDGLIEWVNRGFLEHIGLEREDVLGRFQRDFLAPDCPREGMSKVTAAFRNADAVRAELRIRRADGQARWIEVNMTPLVDPDGEVRHYINVERDVTEARQKAAELAEARQAAETAAREKAMFLATMSHEIRTPMNGVIGMAEMLSDTGLTGPQSDMVETISTSGEYLLRIIDDILNLSKLEAGRMEVESEPFAPKALMRTSAAILRPLAERKGIELDLTVSDDMPDRLLGDEGRVRQILLNLGGNAIKFTEAGQVSITLARVMDAGIPRLRLCVTDSGVGIEKERLAGIFDTFQQADQTISRRFGGTGLGLSISRLLAKAMGGDIEVTSILGEGSRFTVDLPFRPAPDAPAVSEIPIQKDESSVPAPESESPEARSERTILVVDDNATNRFVMERMLKDGPWQVRFAADGAEAVETCAEIGPDLVFMDLSMPVVDGFEAARRIRAADRVDGAPVTGAIVALTANASDEDRRRTVDAGMDDFLSKPVRKKALLATIDKWTAQPAVSGGAAARPPAAAAPS